MLSKINTAVLHGLEAIPCVVETDINRGMPVFHLVGLADQAVKEAKERIRPAIHAAGLDFPMGRIVVNISPADVRKRGSILDLPMAMGILAGSGQVLTEGLEAVGFLGELSLDGSLNRSQGVLPSLIALQKAGLHRAVIPRANCQEAALIRDMDIYPATSLGEIVRHFNLQEGLLPLHPLDAQTILAEGARTKSDQELDFADVRGRELAKRALTIAAAGGHGILLRGSPASSKTMLAERMPGILPEMSYEEILEVTQIYSVAGLLNDDLPYIGVRPFRSPHHSITLPALVGGGNSPRPGEITLADKGVLFLDEFCEFDRKVIDALRQPLEKKTIQINRLNETYTYPADFLLLAAANPCKCGYYGDPERECNCSLTEVMRYQNRISGPVMNRIDMHLWLEPVKYEELAAGPVITSAQMRASVLAARKVQAERFRQEDIHLNGEMNYGQCERIVRLDRDCRKFISQIYHHFKLNPRSLLKLKKVARTIADIDGNVEISRDNLMEAVQYREKVMMDE